MPGGHAARVYLPTHEGHVAWVLRNEPRVLAIGAQSSLTGGATPFGEALLATERMDQILEVSGDRAVVQSGVALVTLQEAARQAGAFYPPAPTYAGAFVGGTVSTNAAGAATWRYGTTRQWVRALRVVIAGGWVLALRRGEVRASEAGTFAVELPSGEQRQVAVPTYVMPNVPKRSAGYHAEPGMDLVDLFVGAEGTLGVITEIEVGLLHPAPQVLACLVPLVSEAAGLALTTTLRDLSCRVGEGLAPPSEAGALPIRAIESMDARCLQLLREDRALGAVSLPASTGFALLIQVEVPPGLDAHAELERFSEGARDTSPVTRFLGVLHAAGVLDHAEVALPGDRARHEQLAAIREAVPVAVNHRIAAAKRLDPRIHKCAADMIVPFEGFADAMQAYRGASQLDWAIWGHISDGNVHPNAIPTSYADCEAAQRAILEFGREVARLGGCPLSEHGVGRNAIKQELLRELYGDSGIAQMRAVKAALDQGVLAPGVLFSA